MFVSIGLIKISVFTYAFLCLKILGLDFFLYFCKLNLVYGGKMLEGHLQYFDTYLLNKKYLRLECAQIVTGGKFMILYIEGHPSGI